jgi:C_GCAxxG_C_C family probable redox protein
MGMSREQLANIKHEQGFNCAQSVLCVFAEDYGLSEHLALKLASSFGGGMRMAATCGALTGALMVLGLAKGFAEADVDRKEQVKNLTIEFLARWKKVIGANDCKEILGVDISEPEGREQAEAQGRFAAHCPNCISQAVILLEALLAELA